MFFFLVGVLDTLAVWLDAGGSDQSVLEQLVEFLVFLETEEDVAGDDSALLVFADHHDRDFQELGNEVLEDGSEEDGGTEADAFGVASFFEEPGDSADGE